MENPLLRLDQGRVVLGSETTFPLTLAGVTSEAVAELETLFANPAVTQDPRALERALADIIARFALRCTEVDEHIESNSQFFEAEAAPHSTEPEYAGRAEPPLRARLDVDLDALFATRHEDQTRLAATVRRFGFENLRFYERIAREHNILKVASDHRDRARLERLVRVALVDLAPALPTDELIDAMPLKEINAIASADGHSGYTRKAALKTDLQKDPQRAASLRAALDSLDYCRSRPFPEETSGHTLEELATYLRHCEVVAELIARTFFTARFWRRPAEQLDLKVPFIEVLGVPDDRMCDLCAEEHRKIYLATKSPPRPFHLACRCSLSPIVYLEAIRMGLMAREGTHLTVLNENPGKLRPE